MITIATHDKAFHADDVFGVAILLLVYPDASVIRTRDPQKLAQCQFRVDVGRKNSPDTGDFDHHQPEGGGQRPNGVPYASAGLVWKAYGKKLCDPIEAAMRIEHTLIQSIDAHDNRVHLFSPLKEDASPYLLSYAIQAFNPDWTENPPDFDGQFKAALGFATTLLKRELIRAHAATRLPGLIEQAVANATDSRLLTLPDYCPWKGIVGNKYPQVRFVVYPERPHGWHVEAVPVPPSGEYQYLLPQAWAGKEDEALVEITGVADALFCHRQRFIAGATSQAGAQRLAQQALDNSRGDKSHD